MKKLLRWLMIMVTAAWSLGSRAEDSPSMARVTSDRVNMRARPDVQSETVGQLSADMMISYHAVSDEWVEITPPDSVDFWVHREFVVDDKVVVNKLNVRSGAGINHQVVGTFSRGETIQRRGSFGEWIKVAAPPDARLWVSRPLLEIIPPTIPVPPPVAAPAALDVSMPSPEPDFSGDDYLLADRPPVAFDVDEHAHVRPSAPPPADLRLIPLDGQGRIVRREGLLKRSPRLILKAPGAHRLVRREGNSLVTTAYIRGNPDQLDALIDRNLVIEGREYWVQDVKVPVMVVEGIEKRSY